MAKEMSYLISKTDPVATALGTDLLTGSLPLSTGLKSTRPTRSVPRAVEGVSKLSFAAPKARNVEAWAIGPGTSSIKCPSAESA
jgi:hypothetical protein